LANRWAAGSAGRSLADSHLTARPAEIAGEGHSRFAIAWYRTVDECYLIGDELRPREDPPDGRFSVARRSGLLCFPARWRRHAPIYSRLLLSPEVVRPRSAHCHRHAWARPCGLGVSRCPGKAGGTNRAERLGRGIRRSPIPGCVCLQLWKCQAPATERDRRPSRSLEFWHYRRAV